MSSSNFYYGASQHAAAHMNHPQHHHSAGRPRRAPRSAAAHNHKQFRAARPPKEAVEAPRIAAFRRDFEAARSFDLEDDELFCPFHLLTDDDLQSIHSSGSDRSSLSSGSPESSPLQQQLQPTPSFVLPAAANTFTPASFSHQTQATKLHQPLAQRTRNAIPIVDPTTRNVASPPPSVSPARQMQQQQQQFMSRRW